MTLSSLGILNAPCRSGFLFAAALAIAWAGPTQAAPRYVKTSAVRVFHLDSKQIAVSDGADSVLDAGFIPPGGTQFYWLQPGLGRQHLYFYDLATGTRKEVSRFIPDGALPASLSWSPDGGRFAFADGTKLIVVTTADRSSRGVDVSPDGFKPGQIYWVDSGHIIGTCGNAICLADLDAGKPAVVARPKLRFSQPQLDVYLPADRSFLWGTWGPDSGSAMFLSTLGDTGASKSRDILFPQVEGDSSISATADGTYALVSAYMDNGDGPGALFMGNIKSGRWARLLGSKPWGKDFFARISPRGNWIAVVASATVKKHEATYLYLVRVPSSLRKYLDGKPAPKKPHR